MLVFSGLLLYVAGMFWRRGRRPEHQKANEYTPMSWPQVGSAGGLGGFVAALAGIGGGGVMVPIMNIFQDRDFQKAVSISSLAIVIISLSGWIHLALLESDPTLTEYYIGQVDSARPCPWPSAAVF